MHDEPSSDQPWRLPRDPDHQAAPATHFAKGPARQSAGTLGQAPVLAVCPFLHTIDPAGAQGAPIDAPDPANRCAALAEPVPQSFRQQELVCLTSGHVNCPRYARGSTGSKRATESTRATVPTVANESTGTTRPTLPTVLTERVHSRPRLTKATAGALAVLVVAFLVSIGFVVANGGLVLTAAVPPTGGVLGEIETAPPGAAPTPVVTAVPTPVATPSIAPSPTPIATPVPATPVPTPKPTPRPTSDRYALLTPCPGTPNCYVYVIRSGDNLFSIARYFGVSQKTVEAMNPWVKNGLVAGRGLRIPTPTR